MSKEIRQETMEAMTESEMAVAVEPMTEGAVAAEPGTVAEEIVTVEPGVVESTDDYTDELEAPFKESDKKRSRTYVEDESPDAEKWQELRRMLDGKAITKVKVKGIVEDGAIVYVDEMKAFIPASQLSLSYVENLEEFVGQYLEVHAITTGPEVKCLVLSTRDILKKHQEAEESEAPESYKAGDIMEGIVDSVKPYGVFVSLDGGMSGLLHIPQISTQGIRHPSVVLKEDQEVKMKVLSVADGKTSPNTRVLEEAKAEADEHIGFDYKGGEVTSTGFGDLPKGLKSQCFIQ